jgi:hypothetical protein
VPLHLCCKYVLLVCSVASEENLCHACALLRPWRRAKHMPVANNGIAKRKARYDGIRRSGCGQRFWGTFASLATAWGVQEQHNASTSLQHYCTKPFGLWGCCLGQERKPALAPPSILFVCEYLCTGDAWLRTSHMCTTAACIVLYCCTLLLACCKQQRACCGAASPGPLPEARKQCGL